MVWAGAFSSSCCCSFLRSVDTLSIAGNVKKKYLKMAKKMFDFDLTKIHFNLAFKAKLQFEIKTKYK